MRISITAIRFMLAALAVAIALPCTAELKSVKEGSWEISVAYPRFASTSRVATSTNAASQAMENKDYKMFLSRASTEIPTLKGQGRTPHYDLIVVPTISLDTSTICSGCAERYVFTAGANGNTTYRVLNRALISGTVRDVKLQDLFKKGANGTAEASKALLAALRKRDPVPEWVASGTWKGLTKEQAVRFNITPAGLLFLFDKYDLGPGAEGTHRVLVSYGSLPGLNKQGILKPVLSAVQKSQVGILTTGRWLLKSIQYSDDRVLKTGELDDCWVEFRGGTMTGQAGINRVHGQYSANADGTLKIQPMAMTGAANPKGSIAEEFERRIGQIDRFHFKDGRLILEMPFDTGIMTFEW